MAYTTIQVQGLVTLPTNEPAAGYRLKFELKKVDRDSALVVPHELYYTIPEDGNIDVPLWPNARGNAGTVYHVYLIPPREPDPTRPMCTLTVPDVAGPVNIWDHVDVGPAPTLSDAESAELAAQNYAGQASSSASAAAASASIVTDWGSLPGGVEGVDMLSVQKRRGSTSDHSSFTGEVAEVTVDTDKKSIVVHDGATPGGFPGGGFTAAETGAAIRSMESKVSDVLSIKDFGVPSDGTAADMTAVDAAFAAASGKALHFPSGVYNFSRSPAGLDDVFTTGDPFTNFSGTKIPLFTGVFTGNKQIAIAAAVLRYYAADEAYSGNAAGWFLIQAKSGAHHDPVLLGPITASGAGSVILDVDFEEFGIDPALWTPSGFCITADEGFATDGVDFGGSVGTTSVTILGAHSTMKGPYVRYASGAWGGSNDPYSYQWVSGSTAFLRVTRDANSMRKAISAMGAPMVMMRNQGSDKIITPAVNAISGDSQFEIRFFDHSTSPPTQMLTEDEDMKFWLLDPYLKPPSFIFNEDPGNNRNIWMVGVFTKKEAEYPS